MVNNLFYCPQNAVLFVSFVFFLFEKYIFHKPCAKILSTHPSWLKVKVGHIFDWYR